MSLETNPLHSSMPMDQLKDPNGLNNLPSEIIFQSPLRAVYDGSEGNTFGK